MKRSARNKAKNNNTTGAQLMELTPVDELMMDFEGRDSVYMVGLKEPDNPPVLPNANPLVLPKANAPASTSENEDSEASFMEVTEASTFHVVPGKKFQRDVGSF